MSKDFYEILDVKKDASQEDIKKAYRKFAIKYHPDKNNGNKESEERFKEISAAYEILGDESSRNRYDTGGLVDSDFNDFSGFNFDEMMSHAFGGDPFSRFSQNPRQNKQRNIHINISVDLDDIFNGSSKIVSFNRKVFCSGCHGEKTKDSDGIVICDKCKGSGRLMMSHDNMTRIIIQCPECGGKGKKIINPCPDCKGNGFRVDREKIKFDINPGCPNGHRIVERGKGHQYEKYGYGDLVILIYTNEHPIYNRVNERDIAIELSIPVHVSIIGGKLDVPTVHGIKEISIPQGIRDGQRIVYRGVGLPICNTKSFGDMYIVCRLETPLEISDEIREMFSNIPIDEKSYPFYSATIDKANETKISNKKPPK